MARNLTALIAGFVFGLGLTVSQMINPAKVLGFLDILGDWDPSLAFVMAAGLLVTGIGYHLTWRRPAPFFAENFQVPGNRELDAKLATGALLFGVGWGLVGLCPGPAIAAITIGGAPALVFLAAMAAGMGTYELYDRVTARAEGMAS